MVLMDPKATSNAHPSKEDGIGVIVLSLHLRVRDLNSQAREI